MCEGYGEKQDQQDEDGVEGGRAKRRGEGEGEVCARRSVSLSYH